MDKTYRITGQETVHSGFFKMNRYRLRHTSFRGGWCDEIERERLELRSAVSILLYDPRCDSLVLVEQFRIGVMGDIDPPWNLETVSGLCDGTHETPEKVARREVSEESGCSLHALTPIGSFFVSPGLSRERIHLFCGWVDAKQAGGVHGLAQEGEEMQVVVLPRREALDELFGRLNSTSVIIAVQWLEANRPRLLAEWGIDLSAS